MRIRDWSSDVCSSDLLLLVVDHLLAAVVLDVWLVGDLGALGGGRGRRLLGQRRLRRAAGGILVTVGALALRRVGVEGALDALAGCGRCPADQQRPESHQRSEENTSELQSLMRI